DRRVHLPGDEVEVALQPPLVLARRPELVTHSRRQREPGASLPTVLEVERVGVLAVVLPEVLVAQSRTRQVAKQEIAESVARVPRLEVEDRTGQEVDQDAVAPEVVPAAEGVAASAEAETVPRLPSNLVVGTCRASVADR